MTDFLRLPFSSATEWSVDKIAALWKLTGFRPFIMFVWLWGYQADPSAFC